MSSRDHVENTRLFILSGKGVKEDTLREKFEAYGKIVDLWIVKDKRTNEDKGVVYITYSKCSEAALALEEMNGKILEGNPRPLKVIMANDKRDGSVRDPREEEKLTRLFVIIPKSFTEDDLTNEFSKFGEVQSVNVLKDKETGAHKGFGFVRFNRPYHAALAMENCDRSFKPKFAEPKKTQEAPDMYDRESLSRRGGGGRYEGRDERYEGRGDRRGGAPGSYPFGDRGRDQDFDRERGLKRSRDDFYDRDARERRNSNHREDYIADDGRSRYSAPVSLIEPIAMPASHSVLELLKAEPHTNCEKLIVNAPMGLAQNYLYKLFDLVPGLEYCDLNEQTGVAYVRYKLPQCAAYAKSKLDQFEFPAGNRLAVQFADAPQNHRSPSVMASDSYYSAAPGSYRGGGAPMDLLGENSSSTAMQVQQAQSILNNPMSLNASHSQSAQSPDGLERVTYCNIKLPICKPMLPETTPCEQRLFIVCQPASVPERILRDIFSRFGGLIEVYLLSGRNFGYAKYASKESAFSAINTMHGVTVAGQRLKVIEAEPQRKELEADMVKRLRTESP
ncbi:RNA-binding protein 45-like isoform X2 [Dreissena polymorpha]|uniref:RNA-binding protein 45-like isoform X2 n=1 Tax=Dreissena polymorpha TaxID=45954 RepID=UPI002264EED3|nr:RNA-binding protein 45-like isoform X2 [Dreissena polymorpha]